jgi:hypothetical protein
LSLAGFFIILIRPQEDNKSIIDGFKLHKMLLKKCARQEVAVTNSFTTGGPARAIRFWEGAIGTA